MTALPASAVAALLQAISDRLTVAPMPPGSTGYTLAVRAVNSDVRLAVAAILGQDCTPATVAQFTRLLAAPPVWPEPAPQPAWDADGYPANLAAVEADAAEAAPLPAQRFTTHCPICSGHLEADGSHVCPGSGARIPPAGLDAECEPHPDDCACAGHGVCEYWNTAPTYARAE